MSAAIRRSVTKAIDSVASRTRSARSTPSASDGDARARDRNTHPFRCDVDDQTHTVAGSLDRDRLRILDAGVVHAAQHARELALDDRRAAAA